MVDVGGMGAEGVKLRGCGGDGREKGRVRGNVGREGEGAGEKSDILRGRQT